MKNVILFFLLNSVIFPQATILLVNICSYRKKKHALYDGEIRVLIKSLLNGENGPGPQSVGISYSRMVHQSK